MNNAIADQIKEMLVENLRIPENILTYDSELFGDEIGLNRNRCRHRHTFRY